MRTIILAVLGSLTLLVTAGLVGYCWWKWPNLSVENLGSHVVVHTELLAEYPSNISLIEVTEAASEKSVWRVTAEGEMVQMHSFALKVGANEASPPVFWGRFRNPGEGAARTFRLDAGVAYVIRVCASTAVPLCNSKTFQFT